MGTFKIVSIDVMMFMVFSSVLIYDFYIYLLVLFKNYIVNYYGFVANKLFYIQWWCYWGCFGEKEHEMFLEVNEYVFVYDLPLIELFVNSLVGENFMDACQ